MLAVQLQVGFGDVVGVGHVVVDSCSRQPVCAGAVLLSPADRSVDRHIRDMDALRHQFSRHALRESGLGMTCHCKGAARREAFQRCAGVREDDRSLRAIGVGFVSEHASRCLLTDQKRAERRVANRFERHGGVGFDYWERNILPDQKEDYGVVFGRLGFNIDPRTRHALFGGVGVKFPFFVSENAHLDELGFDQNERLHPKGELSVYAHAGYRFTQGWSLIGYYDGYRFGESKAVTATSSAFPGTRFLLFQPASKVDSFGVKLQYEFR